MARLGALQGPQAPPRGSLSRARVPRVTIRERTTERCMTAVTCTTEKRGSEPLIVSLGNGSH
jgi:hypothetical protein